MNESAIGTGVSTESVGAANQAAESPPVSQSSGAQTEQSSTEVKTQPVQGETTTQTQQSDDPLAGFPSDDELKAAVANKTPFAEQAARIKEAYSALKPQFDEVSGKFTPFQPHIERFENPEQLQNILALQDALIGWEKDAQSGELIPATLKGAEQLARDYPQHADFLAADLLNGNTIDRETGRTLSRLDLALESMAKVDGQRAKVAKIFGLVEPSSISPQWQPTEDQLAVVRPELQDVFKQLPYEEREQLSTNSPDYINRVLEREKFTQELQAQAQQTQLRGTQQAQAREQYLAQQANQAGDTQVQTMLTEALTTFHNSVVEQCNFIAPLDMASLPQGMSPEQAVAMNQQIAASNKAEAAQLTSMVVNLLNEQTRPFVLPMLQEIGVVDEKFMKDLDGAAKAFGDNARNYGHLSYRGKLQANGNGYQPDASITKLNNEATRNLKLLAHYANQIKGRLMEKRSQFFQMKATDHNQTLNSVSTSRALVQGSTFDPNSAASAQIPTGPMTRKQIDALYG